MPRTVAPLVPPGSLRASAQPELNSVDGLLLRPWQPDNDGDVTAVLAAFADAEIQHWGARVVVDADEARVWMGGWAAAWEAETDACWAIVRGDDVVGRVALRRIDLASGTGEVAYWVLPGARGQGVASAATEAVARWAFDRVHLHRVELCHSVHNEGSCSVARRTGFAWEGTLRDGMRHVDGWHDMHLHARLAPGGTR
jgi:RimJ/RimL family protein N-acetyltransferase